jgi:hypothetical protein
VGQDFSCEQAAKTGKTRRNLQYGGQKVKDQTAVKIENDAGTDGKQTCLELLSSCVIMGAILKRWRVWFHVVLVS